MRPNTAQCSAAFGALGLVVDKRVLEMFFADLHFAFRALLLTVAQVLVARSQSFLPGRTSRYTTRNSKACFCEGSDSRPIDADAGTISKTWVTSACPHVGVLAHRAGPLERAAARICREAGASVSRSVALSLPSALPHVRLADMNIDFPVADKRPIHVVANGLPAGMARRWLSSPLL